MRRLELGNQASLWCRDPQAPQGAAAGGRAWPRDHLRGRGPAAADGLWEDSASAAPRRQGLAGRRRGFRVHFVVRLHGAVQAGLLLRRSANRVACELSGHDGRFGGHEASGCRRCRRHRPDRLGAASGGVVGRLGRSPDHELRIPALRRVHERARSLRRRRRLGAPDGAGTVGARSAPSPGSALLSSCSR